MEHENMDRCIFMLWMDWDWELTLRSAELTNIWTVLSKKKRIYGTANHLARQ